MTKKIFLKILIIIFPILFSAGLMWIYALNVQTQDESTKIKNEYIKEQKREIKERIDIILKNIALIKELRYKRIKNTIKENVKLASTIVENMYQKYHGKVSEDELKEMIIESLRGIRFLKGRGYFFITAMDGTSILHGNIKTLETTNFADEIRIGSNKVHKAILNTLSKSNEGFVEYNWIRSKNINDKASKKISYVKYFDKYDWYIGAGDYVEDIQNELERDLLTLIGQTKYGKDDFVFILSDSGEMLLHVDKEVIGKKVIKAKDKNGFFFVKELIKVAKNNENGGYVQYHSLAHLNIPNKGEKISFARYEKDFNWIIGTGVFLESINKVILEKQNKLKQEQFFIVALFIIIFIITSLLIIFIVNKFKETIDASFEKFVEFFKKAATDNVSLDVDTMDYQEFETLAIHTNELVNKIKSLNQTLEDRVKERTKDLKLANKELKDTLVKLDNTESSLIQNEKMAALGELVAGVTHEINTPVGLSLTGITHFSEISKNLKTLYESNSLSKDEFEDFIRVANELADTITINLKRAADIIKSFKTIAIDQTNIEKREFNFRNYIDEILLSLKNKTKKVDIDFVIECDENLEINSYPGAISQIFTNLIMNSIIHGFETTNKGTIKIIVTKHENSLHVEFSDDGKGIAKEHMNKLFRPFFTTKKSKGGSGLGLNIIYKIITEQLGGTIKCESYENEGTKFFIDFPI